MARDDQFLTYAKIDVAAGGTYALVIPDGQFAKIVHLFTTCTLDGTVRFRTGVTDLSGDMTFKAGSGPSFRSSVDEPFIETTVEDEDFSIVCVTTGLDGFIAYYIEGS